MASKFTHQSIIPSECTDVAAVISQLVTVWTFCL